MTESLIVCVLCLTAANVLLAASVPFLFWRCFRFEWRMERERDKMQKQVDTLDEALSRLLDNVGVPQEKREESR